MYFISDIEKVDSFCEEACMNKNSSTWNKRRKEADTYGHILITAPGFTMLGGTMWCWWRDYVGLEVFARIEIEQCPYTGKNILREAYPVRLTTTRIVQGRGIPSDCFSLI